MVVETAACTSFFFPEGKVLSAGSLKFGRGVQYKASFVYMSTSLLRGSQMHAAFAKVMYMPSSRLFCTRRIGGGSANTVIISTQLELIKLAIIHQRFNRVLLPYTVARF
jgi:hypothetical protein